MHSNSLKTYREEKDHLGERALLIWHHLLNHAARTDRQIMGDLNFTEGNKVRPRLTELIKSHWCFESGDIEDPTTHKRVRLVSARTPKEREAYIRSLLDFESDPQLDLFKAA